MPYPPKKSQDSHRGQSPNLHYWILLVGGKNTTQQQCYPFAQLSYHLMNPGNKYSLKRNLDSLRFNTIGFQMWPRRNSYERNEMHLACIYPQSSGHINWPQTRDLKKIKEQKKQEKQTQQSPPNYTPQFILKLLGRQKFQSMYQNHHHKNYSYTSMQYKQKKTFLFHYLTQKILALRVLGCVCVLRPGPDGPLNHTAWTDFCPKGAGSGCTTIKTGVGSH